MYGYLRLPLTELPPHQCPKYWSGGLEGCLGPNDISMVSGKIFLLILHSEILFGAWNSRKSWKSNFIHNAFDREENPQLQIQNFWHFLQTLKKKKTRVLTNDFIQLLRTNAIRYEIGSLRMKCVCMEMREKARVEEGKRIRTILKTFENI